MDDLFFNTLANRKRLQILEYLMEHGEANVSEITAELQFNQSTVSQNLTRLERCGFVHREKDRKQRIYRINEDTIEPLINLTEHPEYAQKYDVMAAPGIIINEKKVFQGGVTEAELRAALDERTTDDS